ncbi:Resolvase domain [Rhizobium leguminosarum bv. trifolii WSM2304]|uniref:Resolvase domain n=1 Tax=Rhizobium leguminosarum bv. trifolii (strain WSM2304) TaxID=395492 RepID=A0ABF7QT36_RHILW|nr:recombinase family protein [Rhizobium leguminosarum]ACI57423.1 Resolvase domain [Rhizobium leguminosarum bv. trifolii WSM2304]
MDTRLYLRASTSEQDASRAESELRKFADERGLKIVGTYIENQSGAKLARPELFRLLRDSHAGDIMLIEQVDRLSRLATDDWAKLKTEIDRRGVRVVSLDLPTSHQAIAADEFTSRMYSALNGMMLDVLAAVAAKDYSDRRRRQAQGIEKAKQAGRYNGRPEDKKRNEAILKMLSAGQSWSNIIAATGCSRSTLSRLARRRNEGAGK